MRIERNLALSRQPYGRAPYWARDIESRTHIDKWAEWSKINFALNFSGPVFSRIVRTPAEKRDPNALKETRSESWIGISTLPKDSSGTAHFSAAMVSRSPMSNSATCSPRYFDLPTERPGRDRLRAHHERLTGRPAYHEHVMIPYDELRVSGA